MQKLKRNEQLIQLERMVAKMPGAIYWKDTQGKFLACNDNQTKVLGLKRESMLGKNTIEVGALFGCTEENSIQAHQNSLDVLQTLTYKQIEEIVTINGKIQTVLSQKSPVITSDGALLGLAGISIWAIHRKNFKKTENYLEKITSLIQLYVQNIFPKLSDIELQCLYFLIQRMSFKEIARALNLSVHAIESCIDHMKHKLDCANRLELIGKAIDLGYVNLTFNNFHHFH